MINGHDKFIENIIKQLEKSITFDKKWDLKIMWKQRNKILKYSLKHNAKNHMKTVWIKSIFWKIPSKVITIK